MSDEIINTDLLHHDQTNSDSQPAWGSFCTPIPNSHFWPNLEMLLEWANDQPKSESMDNLIIGIANTIEHGYKLVEVRHVTSAMKELVREIFGEDAANDKDIVSFYEEVNKTAIDEYFKPNTETISNEYIVIEQELPPPYVLVWAKRKTGHIYIGYRIDFPISTNPDASRDCYWYGASAEDQLNIKQGKFSFRFNFSDVTVESWAHVIPPIVV